MNTKKCSGCGEIKEIGEFFVDKCAPAGVVSRCKTCLRKRRAAEYAAKRDPMKIMHRRLTTIQQDLQRTQKRVTKMLEMK